MNHLIQSIDALEILDSRGFPTLRVTVTVESGVQGTASAPAGASTGEHEIAERRDGDLKRFGGKGVLRAVQTVTGQVNHTFTGLDVRNQSEIDQKLGSFWGQDQSAEFGANVMCAVSMAIACAAAKCADLPLYRYLGGPCARRLPVPMMNVINGGKHADNSLDFQEFMIVPHGAPSFSEALRYGVETFHALKALLRSQGHSTAVGDEGGFAPNLKGNEQACDFIVQAIVAAGLKPGSDVAIALDPAASSFWDNGKYVLQRAGGGEMSSFELGTYYRRLIDAFPIVSIEDGFDENDWDGFRTQTQEIGERIQIVGDDLYTTDAARIRRGVLEQSTNAVLIKINQIGTLTTTTDAIDVCRDSGQRFIVSHRSGETEDTFIADFSVAMGGGQIKTGSLSRSERMAKYNRLLEIEHELGDSAKFKSPFIQKTPSKSGSAIESPHVSHEMIASQLSGAALIRERAELRRSE
jgi:enolase